MPPKIQFNREMLLDTAFNLLRKEGLQAVSARNLAQKLNASPGPLYRVFGNMDRLKEELVAKAIDILFEYAEKTYTDGVFLNVEVGITLFARDEPKLFTTLFLEQAQQVAPKVFGYFSSRLDKDSVLFKFPEEARRRLLLKLHTFTLGYSMQIIMGTITNADTKSIVLMQRQVGKAFIAEEFKRLPHK